MSSSLRFAANVSKRYISQEVCLTGLWVEEVNHGQEKSIRNSPYDPETPSKVLDTDGRDFHNDEVCDPITL